MNYKIYHWNVCMMTCTVPPTNCHHTQLSEYYLNLWSNQLSAYLITISRLCQMAIHWWSICAKNLPLVAVTVVEDVLRMIVSSQNFLRETVSGQNVVWETVSGQNVLWDTVSGQNVLWRTVSGQNVLWKTVSGQNVLWETVFLLKTYQ